MISFYKNVDNKEVDKEEEEVVVLLSGRYDVYEMLIFILKFFLLLRHKSYDVDTKDHQHRLSFH